MIERTPPLSIRLDTEGWLRCDSDVPQMLVMFLEDLGCNLAACDKVLTALADVRAGRRPVYQLTTDAVHLFATLDGASFTIAAKLTRNEPVSISLDGLEHGVRSLREFTESLPEDQRW